MIWEKTNKINKTTILGNPKYRFIFNTGIRYWNSNTGFNTCIEILQMNAPYFTIHIKIIDYTIKPDKFWLIFMCWKWISSTAARRGGLTSKNFCTQNIANSSQLMHGAIENREFWKNPPMDLQDNSKIWLKN